MIDQVEDKLIKNFTEAIGNDKEYLMHRIDDGKLLRIGLTNRMIIPTIRNPKAYCYVDRYRDVEDIVAACILSSFVPGVTGPLRYSSPTINRAAARIHEMMELGFIKRSLPNGKCEVVQAPNITKQEQEEVHATNNPYPIEGPLFFDGGLSNAFPIVDEQTVVVTPISGIFDPHPAISPKFDEDSSTVKDQNLIRLSHRVSIILNRQFATTLRHILLSSDDEILHQRFHQGYDDAKRFLQNKNLINTHSNTVPLDVTNLRQPKVTTTKSNNGEHSQVAS